MAFSLKQSLFIEAYIGAARGNATEAARIAGYKDPEQAGYENKRKQELWAEIERKLRERTLSGEEVLERLTQHANTSLEPFLYMKGDVAVIDLSTEIAQANLHLLKKVKCKRRSGGKPEDRWEEIETEIEIHDPQAALVQLGRHHKLFTDKSEQTVNGTLSIYDEMSIEDIERRIAEIEGRETEGAASAEPA